eukprot:Sspe_Gene.33484::Locus_16350_Transcript_1_1_Confidence_1.000_Length_2773::g.33484::m.33484/K19191/mabO; 4-methylaminobutanoate oxidase (formaldehyde-forming)
MMRRLSPLHLHSTQLAGRRWASTKKVPPAKANVVVVGGGVIGCSVAYHLTKAGMQDVVLLERGKLTSGTTWHAAGLIGQLRRTTQETALSSMGAKTFKELLELTGQDTGFKQCGSLSMSRTPDRTTFLKRAFARAEAFGVTADIISPEEAQKKFPILDPKTFECALWLPGDGTASPTDVTMAFMKGAKMGGARFYEDTRVTGFAVDKGVVRGVVTDEGEIECNRVVLCAGLWSHQLGQLAGVNVPLHACEHFYIITEKMEGVDHNLPVMRDPDRWAYYREWGEGLCLGGFEPNAKPCFIDGPPDRFEFSLLEDDMEHFYPVVEAAYDAVPLLRDTPIRNMVNGPESFTPDNQYILGESPEVANFWVAAGMNSSGIASSSGAGWALSRWMADGVPPFDLAAVDIRRFGPYSASQQFVRARSSEVLGLHYRIPYPRLELLEGRGIRRSPIFRLLKEQGAVYGSKFGWERPLYFDTKGEIDPQAYTFAKPQWLGVVTDEYRHTRKECSVFDVTSFAKFSVCGPDAERFCNYVATANMKVPIGKTVFTLLVNEFGGIESDCTITRVSEEEYYVVSPCAHGTLDLTFMRHHAKAGRFKVTISDVTSSHAVLSVQGPKAEALLATVSQSLDKDPLPLHHSRMVDVGPTWVRAINVSYVGERGIELHIPMESQEAVYEHLADAAKKANVDMRNAGY